MTETPIAYIVFNRPELTKESFAVIRDQRPSSLFIIADGPRPGLPADLERCAAVREIVDQVDWPCKVLRNYAENNLGLKQRVSSGLSWVFEKVERAIVLEDDCLAHPDFFSFCEALLDRYSEDKRISVITGNNFQGGQWRGSASYYFSKYNHCWGWATWRRAWKHYDGNLDFWPEWRDSQDWKRLMPEKTERKYWQSIFDRINSDEFDSWAYPWTASVWYRNGLTATPNVNLVSNIGFGPDSTHTAALDSPLSKLATSKIGSLNHPSTVAQDIEADRYVFDYALNGRYQRFPLSWALWLYRKMRSTVAR